MTSLQVSVICSDHWRALLQATRCQAPRERLPRPLLGRPWKKRDDSFYPSLWEQGKIRHDSFWDARGGFVPDAQETFEAVLVAAQRDPEERKLPFMGSAYA